MQTQAKLMVRDMTQDGKVQFIQSLIPDITDTLDQLRATTSKYEALLSRLNTKEQYQKHKNKIKSTLYHDLYAIKIGLYDDLDHESSDLKHCFSSGTTVSNKTQQEIVI